MYLNSRRGEAWMHSLNTGMVEIGETKRGMVEHGHHTGIGVFSLHPTGHPCATRMGPTLSMMTIPQSALG